MTMNALPDDNTSSSGEVSLAASDANTETIAEEDAAGNDNETSKLEEYLARNETKAVRALRVTIFLVLACVAALASVGIYYYSKTNEENAFKNEFTGQGLKVINGFQGDSFTKLQAMASLSHSVTAYALESESKWPFVTIPDSARHFESYLSLTGAASLQFMPIVGPRQRREWESYSMTNQGWIDEDLGVERRGGPGRTLEEGSQEGNVTGPFELDQVTSEFKVSPDSVSRYIKNYVGIDVSPGPWLVWWQYTPAIQNRWFVNFNRLSSDGFMEELRVVQRKMATLSSTLTFKPGLDFQSTQDFEFMNQLFAAGQNGVYGSGEPIAYIHYPIFDSYDEDRKTVAVLTATVYWKSYFDDLLSDTVRGIHCVVQNTLGQAFTYEINGKEASFLGMEDLHDDRFTKFGISAEYSSFADGNETTHKNGQYTGVIIDDEYISYRITVYPSSEFENMYVTRKPIFYALAILSVFLFTALIFLLYDSYVERRQHIVMTTAVKSDAVVASLFPEQVRDRLMEQAMEQRNVKVGNDISNFLSNGRGQHSTSSKPIADFFPETTILFADIRGFTAWSSVREPSQVFILLETIYNAFDKIANSRRVFKVETVGDCYVAVTGLPDPRRDHAVAMARFASDCLQKIRQLTGELEVELGPGTADLTMRFGIHSGPVTAGVLRGEKSRFQLFGDTMNTASRMESTSVRDKIQVSQDTADLLIEAGKGHWLTKRDEAVFAKGKGDMTTYWLQISRGASSTTSPPQSGTSSHSGDSGNDDLETKEVVNGSGAGASDNQKVQTVLSGKYARLIDWNVEVLRKLLKQIIAFRLEREIQPSRTTSTYHTPSEGIVLDEVTEIIELPAFDSKTTRGLGDIPDSVQLSKEVDKQLQELVTSIACMYRNNPFHNFQHASHVTMSVSKLLSRIVAPSDLEIEHGSDRASSLHDHTYGITSDPLTQFACVFSALIHDVDHTGVPNALLVQEGSPIAAAYRNKSVAEQNTVDLSWQLLMQDSFVDLRAAICCNDTELRRFRQLVVNVVLATDIVDKDLKVRRNARWDKAFSAVDDDDDDENTNSSAQVINVNRKATIVMEHLIQASDVAHTMQHWHVFRKWNEMLFNEMSDTYEQGRTEQDPADGWYKGELGFFDFYIIPLAKKLKACGVFGVSSDEYLKYAENNRREWEEKGKAMVAEMVENRKRAATNRKASMVWSSREGVK